jgi:hypothetical protein
VLPHIKKLDDALGDFLARVVCECKPLARLVGWKMTLSELVPGE